MNKAPILIFAVTTHVFSALNYNQNHGNYLCWQRYVDWDLDWAVLETKFDDVAVVPFHREKFSFISSVLRDKGLTKWEGWKGELGFSLRLHEASFKIDGGCLRPETQIDELTVHWSPC